jgi:hypothetical protein
VGAFVAALSAGDRELAMEEAEPDMVEAYVEFGVGEDLQDIADTLSPAGLAAYRRCADGI